MTRQLAAHGAARSGRVSSAEHTPLGHPAQGQGQVQGHSQGHSQGHGQGHSQGTSSTTRDDDRARQTRQKRDRTERRNELKVPRRAEPFIRSKQHRYAVKAVKKPKDGEAKDIEDDLYSTDSRPLQHQRLQKNPPLRNKHRGSVDEVSHNGEAKHEPQQINTAIFKTEDTSLDEWTGFPVSPPPPPRPSTKPASTSPSPSSPAISDFQKRYNPELYPPRPVAPATRREPIRMLNVPKPGPSVSAKPAARQQRPVNTYRGKNAVKRLVQNKKLQDVLLDRHPRPRKDPARMVLKVAGRKEFR